ncbi:hypothetical protein BGX26_011035, partial [Mortierella sp. AD094]
MFGRTGKDHPKFGFVPSENALEKMKARTHSLETRKKMSISKKGDKNPMFGKILSGHELEKFRE